MTLTTHPESSGKVDDDVNPVQSPNPRERGYLLIADMEASTNNKYLLMEEISYKMMVDHNDIIMEACRRFGGVIIGSAGDSIIAKFSEQGDEPKAMVQCLKAAKEIINRFEANPLSYPTRQTMVHGKQQAGSDDKQVDITLRTKVTLQYFKRAFAYRTSDWPGQVIGKEIDLAFRIAGLSWRLQVLVSGAFAERILEFAGLVGPQSLLPGNMKFLPPDNIKIDDLIEAATLQRDKISSTDKGNVGHIDYHFAFDPRDPLDLWITDARVVTRLKGVEGSQDVCLISFVDPSTYLTDEEKRRLRIKLKQDYHAVIMVNVSLEQSKRKEYIPNLIDSANPADKPRGRLDSEMTVCVAGEIFGDFDIFFRVSCIDDESLRRFFAMVRDSSTVTSISVRQTLGERFWVNPKHAEIIRQYDLTELDSKKPSTLVLTWFEKDKDQDKDLFDFFKAYMDDDYGKYGCNGPPPDVVILEAGEVIHSSPFYALFACASLREYEKFFDFARLNSTKSHSYIVHSPGKAHLQLRYHLIDGVFIPLPISRPKSTKTSVIPGAKPEEELLTEG